MVAQAAQRSIAVAQQLQGSVVSVCVVYKVMGTTSDVYTCEEWIVTGGHYEGINIV